MVCDGFTLASTAASVLMNGVCCVWQMQGEEDQRLALRQDIRAEYERQRRIDQVIWEERMQNMHNNGKTAGGGSGSSERLYHSDSSLQTTMRRQKLLTHKRSVASAGSLRSSGDIAGDHSTACSTIRTAPVAPWRRQPALMMEEDEQFSTSGRSVPAVFKFSEQRQQQHNNNKAGYWQFVKATESKDYSDISSLIDTELSDDDDEEQDEDDDDSQSSLVDIAL